jgi:hypothetical protein
MIRLVLAASPLKKLPIKQVCGASRRRRRRRRRRVVFLRIPGHICPFGVIFTVPPLPPQPSLPALPVDPLYPLNPLYPPFPLYPPNQLNPLIPLIPMIPMIPMIPLSLVQIYEAVSERWPAFRMGDNTWKVSRVRFTPRQRPLGDFVTPVRVRVRYPSSVSGSAAPVFDDLPWPSTALPSASTARGLCHACTRYSIREFFVGSQCTCHQPPCIPVTNHLVSLPSTTSCPCPKTCSSTEPLTRAHHSPLSPLTALTTSPCSRSLPAELDPPPALAPGLLCARGQTARGRGERERGLLAGESGREWGFALVLRRGTPLHTPAPCPVACGIQNEFLLAFVLHYIAHRSTVTSSTPSYSTYCTITSESVAIAWNLAHSSSPSPRGRHCAKPNDLPDTTSTCGPSSRAPRPPPATDPAPHPCPCPSPPHRSRLPGRSNPSRHLPALSSRNHPASPGHR